MAQKTVMSFGKILSYRKYELFMERYRSAADDFILPFISKFTKEKPAMFLDVGAGEGYMKHFLNQDNITFHGVEVWKERIKVCEDMGYKIWSFDIEKEGFPFADNTYDVIVASHVLEHLYHPEITLKELHRILKPGGMLVIGVPMHVTLISKILLLKERFFPAARYDHHQFYTMSTLREFLRDYEIEDIRGFRLISSRKRFNWEDKLGFYNFNTWWGRKFPHLTPEVNVVVKKRELKLTSHKQNTNFETTTNSATH